MQDELRNKLWDYFLRLGWIKDHNGTLVFDFLARASDFAAGGVVLDAGAGQQRYSPFFERSLYLAQEHPVAGVINKGIKEFDILSDVSCIPLVDDSIDMIFSTSALEHYEDPESFFAEAFRTLVPGGALFVQVPFAYMEHEQPYDFQRVSRYGLARWFKKHGFCDYSVEATSSSTYTALFLLQHALEDDLKSVPENLRVTGVELLKYAHDFSKAALQVFDHGPHSSTRLPVSVVGIAHKPGVRAARAAVPDKLAFLKEHARLGAEFHFQNQSIVPIPEVIA